jgi:hypothetical protein
MYVNKNGQSYGVDGVIGRSFDERNGGGLTVIDGRASLSVVVMDANQHTTEYTDNTSDKDIQGNASGEISAHEVLGHALGVLSGAEADSKQDFRNSINFSNIYLRAQNAGYYRNGADHGGRMTKGDANIVPDYLK